MKRFIKRPDRERHAVARHRRLDRRRHQLRAGQGGAHRLPEIRQAGAAQEQGHARRQAEGRSAIKVVWTEFPSGPPLLEALNVGAIDFGNTGEAPPIFAQAAGAPILYVAYEPPAPKGEAILVPKDSKITSVADLKGKKVALNKGSNVHYLLVKALEKAGVKYSEIEPVFLAPADARAAFERGAVDAWVIWDPFQAAAEAATGARTLADGTGIVVELSVLFRLEEVHRRRSENRRPRAGPAQRSRRLGQGRHSRPSPNNSRPAIGLPVPVVEVALEAAVLRHQADHRQRDRRSAAGRRYVLRARPHSQADQDFRRGTEAGLHERPQIERQHPLVPADPWRWPLSRHHHRRARGELQLSAPDRAGRGPARLLRRAAADRAKLRGFLGGGVSRRALDRAIALSGGGAARPAIAKRRRAHDRDARPAVERAAAGQCRHRRRSRREQGRRDFPRSRCSVTR